MIFAWQKTPDIALLRRLRMIGILDLHQRVRFRRLVNRFSNNPPRSQDQQCRKNEFLRTNGLDFYIVIVPRRSTLSYWTNTNSSPFRLVFLLFSTYSVRSRIWVVMTEDGLSL